MYLLMIDFRTACNPYCKFNGFLNYFGCQKGFFKTGCAR